MLILTRKEGEGIVIGDDIKVYVVETKGGAIRIGIDAPKNKKIYRQEIYEKISTQNKEATQWDMQDLSILVNTNSQGESK